MAESHGILTPSMDGNLEALQSLLRQRGVGTTSSAWRRNLTELCAAVSAQTRSSSRNRPAASAPSSKKKADGGDATENADKFLSSLALCTSLAGFFRLIDRDNDAKVCVRR